MKDVSGSYMRPGT